MDPVALAVALLFGATLGWGLARRHRGHRAIPVALGSAGAVGAAWLPADRMSGSVLAVGGAVAMAAWLLARRASAGRVRGTGGR